MKTGTASKIVATKRTRKIAAPAPAPLPLPLPLPKQKRAAPDALPGQVWRLPELMAYLSESRTAIYRRMRAEADFPKPVRLGPQSIGWIATEVIAHQRDRLVRLRPANAVASPLAGVPEPLRRIVKPQSRPTTKAPRPTAKKLDEERRDRIAEALKAEASRPRTAAEKAEEERRRRLYSL